MSVILTACHRSCLMLCSLPRCLYMRVYAHNVWCGPGVIIRVTFLQPRPLCSTQRKTATNANALTAYQHADVTYVCITPPSCSSCLFMNMLSVSYTLSQHSVLLWLSLCMHPCCCCRCCCCCCYCYCLAPAAAEHIPPASTLTLTHPVVRV